MNNTTTLPAPLIALPTLPTSKWERERAAFQGLLPFLLTAHAGKFVAIHEQKVVEVGDNKVEVALRVLQRIGNVDIFVGLVSSSAPAVAHSGVRREIPQTEGTP